MQKTRAGEKDKPFLEKMNAGATIFDLSSSLDISIDYCYNMMYRFRKRGIIFSGLTPGKKKAPEIIYLLEPLQSAIEKLNVKRKRARHKPRSDQKPKTITPLTDGFASWAIIDPYHREDYYTLEAKYWKIKKTAEGETAER